MLTSDEVAGLLGLSTWQFLELVRGDEIDPDVRKGGRGGHLFGRRNALAACVSVGLRALGLSQAARREVYTLVRHTPSERLTADFAAGRRYMVACPPNVVPRLLSDAEVEPPGDLTPEALRPFGPVACVLDIERALDVYRDRLDGCLARHEKEAGHALAAS